MNKTGLSDIRQAGLYAQESFFVLKIITFDDTMSKNIVGIPKECAVNQQAMLIAGEGES